MAIFTRRRTPGRESTGLISNANSSLSSAGEVIQLAEKYNISTDPLDLDGLARHLGIAVRRHPMDTERSGYIKQDEGRLVIGINSLHHPKRQKFTFAHELGHYFLHGGEDSNFEDTVLFRDSSFGDATVEAEANKFAAELLMPEGVFRSQIVLLEGDVSELSSRFGVSSLAVSIRAKQLGYKMKG